MRGVFSLKEAAALNLKHRDGVEGACCAGPCTFEKSGIVLPWLILEIYALLRTEISFCEQAILLVIGSSCSQHYTLEKI
jgi:hypothetical protein